MKTKSIYLAAFLLMSAVATFGNENPTSGIAVLSAKGKDVFRVIYKNETANDVKVKLYNSNDEIIHSSSISQTTGFILPLNLSKLNFGEYRLELTDASGKRVERIVYQNSKPVDNIRVSKLTNNEGKFMVSVMSAKNEKVTVRIFDSYNNLLHNEVKNVSGNFAQVYTLKNLKGACTFEVSDDAGRVKTVQF
ncbi:MAG TPA: DUF3244 domain-containing protein [Chryseolinea sp.]|nr:DUF3244 domain-containing protein [Chryseolinea sp.]